MYFMTENKMFTELQTQQEKKLSGDKLAAHRVQSNL
jgi:hypothetical protein